MWFHDYFFVGFVSFAFSLFLLLLALRFFPKWGLMDRPHRYGLSRKAVPYYGGLVIFAAFLVSLIIFVPISKDLLGVLFGAFLIVLVSFLDDKYSLPPLFRLGIHVLAGIIVVLSGVGIHSISNPFGDPFTFDAFIFELEVFDQSFSISLISAIFTVFWMVLIINSLNFLDGLNGLSSGVSSIAFFFLFLLSIREGFHAIDQTTFSVIALILFFCTLAFVLFDFYPAKILPGDTGSMFLGYMLAVLAIFSGGKVATVFLLMGVPILDAFWVIGRRIYNKKLPWRGDLFHLHHRLKDTGLSERQVVLLVYLITFVFGSLALIPGIFYKMSVAFALIVFMLVLAVYLTFFRKSVDKSS